MTRGTFQQFIGFPRLTGIGFAQVNHVDSIWSDIPGQLAAAGATFASQLTRIQSSQRSRTQHRFLPLYSLRPSLCQQWALK